MFRILVVEDDPIMRKLMQRTLTSEGFECLLSASARDGLKMCLRDKPDLLVLDVHLPDANGIELCRKLKSDERIRHIPVLIMTGEASSVEFRIEGLESGAEDYVLKPFETSELVSRIRGILKISSKPSR